MDKVIMDLDWDKDKKDMWGILFVFSRIENILFWFVFFCVKIILWNVLVIESRWFIFFKYFW